MKKVSDFFSKSNFSMMKKYFSSGFFFNLKRKFSAFQRHQPELLGMPERETANEFRSENLDFDDLAALILELEISNYPTIAQNR